MFSRTISSIYGRTLKMFDSECPCSNIELLVSSWPARLGRGTSISFENMSRTLFLFSLMNWLSRVMQKMDFEELEFGIGCCESKFSNKIRHDWKYERCQRMSSGRGAGTPKMLGSLKPVLSQQPASRLASRGNWLLVTTIFNSGVLPRS